MQFNSNDSTLTVSIHEKRQIQVRGPHANNTRGPHTRTTREQPTLEQHANSPNTNNTRTTRTEYGHSDRRNAPNASSTATSPLSTDHTPHTYQRSHLEILKGEMALYERAAREPRGRGIESDAPLGIFNYMWQLHVQPDVCGSGCP